MGVEARALSWNEVAAETGSAAKEEEEAPF